jgi:hypothetical protein
MSPRLIASQGRLPGSPPSPAAEAIEKKQPLWVSETRLHKGDRTLRGRFYKPSNGDSPTPDGMVEGPLFSLTLCYEGA